MLKVLPPLGREKFGGFRTNTCISLIELLKGSPVKKTNDLTKIEFVG